MTYVDSVLCALERLKAETGGLACVGCGHEHNCGEFGCNVIRQAVSLIETLMMQRAEADNG